MGGFNGLGWVDIMGCRGGDVRGMMYGWVCLMSWGVREVMHVVNRWR